MSSELVASRHDAGPFVFNTNLRPQERPIIPSRNGTVVRFLFDGADEPRTAPFRQEQSIGPNAVFRLA
jgi:hypothetical protein